MSTKNNYRKCYSYIKLLKKNLFGCSFQQSLKPRTCVRMRRCVQWIHSAAKVDRAWTMGTTNVVQMQPTKQRPPTCVIRLTCVPQTANVPLEARV